MPRWSGRPRQSTGWGRALVLSKVTGSWLEAVLPLPAGSVTLPAGMEAVTCPSADGVTVKVKIWFAGLVGQGQRRFRR